MKRYEENGWTVMRTAGSRGPYDVVAIHPTLTPLFIQCKVCASEAQAERLIMKFGDCPPMPVRLQYTQKLVVKVARQDERSVSV